MLKDSIWEDLLKPFGEYIVMFINPEGLKQMKELERSGGSEVSSVDDAKNRKNIHGIAVSDEGKITLPSGKIINAGEIIQKASSLIATNGRQI